MKKMMITLAAMSAFLTTSINVVACGKSPDQNENDISNDQYLKEEKLTIVSKSKFENATNLEITNSFIKNAIFSNMIINVNSEVLENYNNAKAGTNLGEVISRKIIKELSANLYLFGICKFGQILNWTDFNLTFEGVVTAGDAGYFGIATDDIFWKINIVDKQNTKITHEAFVAVNTFNFQKLSNLTQENFTELQKSIMSDPYIYQNAFFFLTFNGQKDNEQSWTGVQKVSLQQIINKNIIYLSYHMEGLDLINQNVILNEDKLEIDVLSTFKGYGITQETLIKEDSEWYLQFTPDQDFGAHSIIAKSYIGFSDGDDKLIEIWGSYLQDSQKY